MTLYETLGVASDATTEEINKAYKKLVKDHHPDKGGDNEDFINIKKAYDVLSDPVKREKYDRTGKTDETKSLRKIAEDYISGVFSSIIQGMERREQSISGLSIGAIRESIDSEIHSIEISSASLTSKIEILERNRRLIRRKGEGNDLFEKQIDSTIGDRKQKHSEYQHILSMLKESLLVLDEYEMVDKEKSKAGLFLDEPTKIQKRRSA